VKEFRGMKKKLQKIKTSEYTAAEIAERSGYALNTVRAYLNKAQIKPVARRLVGDNYQLTYGDDALTYVLNYRRTPGRVGESDKVFCAFCGKTKSRAGMMRRDVYAEKKNGDKIAKCGNVKCGKDIVIEVKAAGRPFGYHTKWAKNKGK
jgi:predicted transcriptional regulator